MRTTRKSLIARVKNLGDDEAWDEFYGIYAPILFRYAISRGLSAVDAEEIRDQCLEVLARKMPEFDYDRTKGRFKNWLYSIASGKIIDQMRSRRSKRISSTELGAMEDHATDPQILWERHWRQEHLRFCLDEARGRVSGPSFRAFELLLLHDYSVPDVCRELDLNPNQVYKAKMRVLEQVRLAAGRLGEDGLFPDLT